MSEYLITTKDEPEEDGCYRLTKPAEEVVRCGDCCCCHTVDGHELCIRFNHATSPDGFCAWGERKEVDE